MINSTFESGVEDMDIVIPQKSMFKIDEVCALLAIKPYILRFWESEIDSIRPVTSSTGQKLYDHRDIEILMKLKKLLYQDKLIIEKAKIEIKKLFSDVFESAPLPEAIESKEILNKNLNQEDFEKLQQAKIFLKEVIASLKLKNPLLDETFH